MPALTIEPSPATATSVYRRAGELPSEVWATLRAHAGPFNVILPIALKYLARENNRDIAPGADDHCWIIASTSDCIDFVLSVTDSDIGAYPVFIVSPYPTGRLTPDFLYPRLFPLARALHDAVLVKRVYSVFAVDVITTTFTQIWFSLTGVQRYREPYYHAMFSYCTRKSRLARDATLLSDVIFELRPATTNDLEGVASLCYQFAETSEPFVLSHEGAINEAETLIRNEQVWVHAIRRADEPVGTEKIASIVAFTRNSESVATITKVFTNPEWRRRGCAERLVRRVTKYLLATKQSVALYVAHDNPAATKVYHRVGFLGLGAGAAPVEGVESWLEIGFDREKVELGHW